VFAFFDLDGSGHIDKTEFFLALQKLGIPAVASQVFYHFISFFSFIFIIITIINMTTKRMV
jgi:hypothetical protein